MRADFQPHIHPEIRDGVDRFHELDRLADAPAPVRGDASLSRAAVTSHGAEKW